MIAADAITSGRAPEVIILATLDPDCPPDNKKIFGVRHIPATTCPSQLRIAVVRPDQPIKSQEEF